MRHSYLTSADAARMLNLTPAAVRMAAVQKRLRVTAVTAGGVRLFTRDDVEAFARERAARRGSHERRARPGPRGVHRSTRQRPI